MLRLLQMGLLLGIVVGFAACSGRTGATSGSSSSGGAPAQNLTVKGSDQFKFEPASLTARANAPIHLTLDDNGDALVHDFVIDDAGGKPVKIEAQPNGRVSGDFTVPAGTYQFYCSQPGHKEAGMVGTLVAS
jgi:plastocyanin